MYISVIAKELNIIALQGIAISGNDIIVPTLDNRLLRLDINGNISTLADISSFGIPFGIVETNGNFLVTITALEMGNRLLRVTKSGFAFTIADLSPVCGSFGGPFGVATGENFYVVAIATDVSNSQGRLIRVERNGKITTFSDMADYGTPFAVTASKNSFVVGCESGYLLRASLDGKLTPIVNLLNAGLGIPFDLIEVNDNLIVTTNTGNILQINSDREIYTIVNLSTGGFGIPSGIAVYNNAYIVTTNAGNVLQIAIELAT